MGGDLLVSAQTAEAIIYAARLAERIRAEQEFEVWRANTWPIVVGFTTLEILLARIEEAALLGVGQTSKVAAEHVNSLSEQAIGTLWNLDRALQQIGSSLAEAAPQTRDIVQSRLHAAN